MFSVSENQTLVNARLPVHPGSQCIPSTKTFDPLLSNIPSFTCQVHERDIAGNPLFSGVSRTSFSSWTIEQRKARKLHWYSTQVSSLIQDSLLIDHVAGRPRPENSNTVHQLSITTTINRQVPLHLINPKDSMVATNVAKPFHADLCYPNTLIPMRARDPTDAAMLVA
jgi:hypothetical protein